MKAGRKNTSLVLLGLKTKSERNMEPKKTYKLRLRKKNGNKRKSQTGRGRGGNDDYTPQKDNKVQNEKGCRLGGSTTHVLPEPRAGKMENEITRIDVPPSIEEMNALTPQMKHYQQTLQRLVEVPGDGKSYRDDTRPLNIRLKPNEVYAVRALDNPDYYRTIMIKSNQLNGVFQTLISNPVYGSIPPQMQQVSQEQVFKQMREMNAKMVTGKELDAFPHQGRTKL